MQLTRLDRWLKEKFVYETHILTLRPLDETPRGVRRIDLPEKPGRRYKHLYASGKSKLIKKILDELKNNNQMFTTKVIDKDEWFVQFIAPDGRSVTWYLVSVFLLMGGLAPVVVWVRGLIQSPEFIKNMEGVLEIIKG